MKKFAKMSLVTAVAVAGLTGTASAADLSEAIKGVDISGQFRLRYEDVATQTKGNQNSSHFADQDMDLEVTVKIPVTDNITAVIKVDNANDDKSTVTKSSLNIEDYYFQYVNGATTVKFGQQNIPGSIVDTTQGDGIVAFYNTGAFTVGAAAFMTNSYTDSDDLYSIFAKAKLGSVVLSTQYADVVDLLSVFTVKADATVGPVKVGVEHISKDKDNTANNDFATTKAYISGSVDALSAKLTYVTTGKNGSGSFDDDEADSEYTLWNAASGGKADLSAAVVDLSYAISDKVSVRVAYLDGDYVASSVKRDISETLGQISYKMSSNLNTYFRIAQYEEDLATGSDTEKTRGRIEVKYSF